LTPFKINYTEDTIKARKERRRHTMGVASQALSSADAKKLKTLLANASRVDKAKIEKKIAAIVKRAISQSGDAGLLGNIGNKIKSNILP
jgi:hypothetical protein